MKKSLSSCRSYCQLLCQWTRFSARQSTTVQSTHSAVLPQHWNNNPTSHHCQVSPRRQYCTIVEDVTDGDDDELDDVVPSVPLSQPITNIQAKFRTHQNDPTKHSFEHEGLYYRVPKEDYEKYIRSGQFVGYKKQVKTFQECVIMVRQPALEAFDIIDHASLDYPPIKLLFYGKNGSGKTMTLAHVVHRYAKLGWLTIHLPDMLSLLRYRFTQPREYCLSSYTEGIYDYVDDAMNWLIYFRAQNEHILQDLKTSKDYTWSQRAMSPEGTDLLDVISFGITRKKYASDCIGALLKEIKLKASEKQFKVLVAIEGVNGLWKNTTIKDERRMLVNAQQVSTFQHFCKLFEPDWTNGICVGTVCAGVETLDSKDHVDKVPYTPQFLLKKQGFEFMDPFIPVLVPEYTAKEAHNCIDYFIERKWIIKPRGLTEEGKKELMMLSNKNPHQLMTISTQW